MHTSAYTARDSLQGNTRFRPAPAPARAPAPRTRAPHARGPGRGPGCPRVSAAPPPSHGGPAVGGALFPKHPVLVAGGMHPWARAAARRPAAAPARPAPNRAPRRARARTQSPAPPRARARRACARPARPFVGTERRGAARRGAAPGLRPALRRRAPPPLTTAFVKQTPLAASLGLGPAVRLMGGVHGSAAVQRPVSKVVRYCRLGLAGRPITLRAPCCSAGAG